MEEINHSDIVPEHYTGKIIDTESTIEFNSPDEAKSFFKTVRERLLDVNSWHQLAGVGTAEFQVVDKEGMEVDRPVQKGDYFKINVPGPGPASGEGYDWVRVEEIKEVSGPVVESVGIRVRPCPSPQNDDQEIAHFYSEESTSNFIVAREGQKITAGIYDRNTKPNKDAESLDKARDMVVGLVAVTGFSKFQWHQLAEGLLET